MTPDQPEKRETGSAAGTSLTVKSSANTPLQVAPQSMPAGTDVTAPTPAPAFCTVTFRVFGPQANQGAATSRPRCAGRV